MNARMKAIVTIIALCALTLLPAFAFSGASSEQLQAMIASAGYLAPVVYIALFALLPIVFFPVAALAVAGGLLFGLVNGSIYTLIGAAVNCMLMFLLSRSMGRKRVQTIVQERLSPVWRQRLRESDGKKGFFLLIILRLIPAVPYGLINYAFGLSEMRLLPYLIASVIGIIPGTLVFINLGDKSLNPASPAFWIAAGLLAALFCATLLIGKKLFPGIPSEQKEAQDA